MPQYRCYILDKNDKIAAESRIQAEDDAGALTKAADRLRVAEAFPVIEVWYRQRMVGRVLQRDHKVD